MWPRRDAKTIFCGFPENILYLKSSYNKLFITRSSIVFLLLIYNANNWNSPLATNDLTYHSQVVVNNFTVYVSSIY